MALRDNLVVMWEQEHDPAMFPIWNSVFPHANQMTGVNFDPELSPPGSLVDAKVGKGILLNGTSQHLLLDNSAGISHEGNAFTIGWWFRPASLKNGASLLTSDEWLVITEQVGGDFFVKVTFGGFVDAPTDVTIPTPLVVGQWYFLAFGFRPDEGRVFAVLDMKLAVYEPRTTLQPAVLTAYIGAGLGSLFHGTSDDLAIWRRAVDVDELIEIHNGGAGLSFSNWDLAAKPCKAITCCD